MRRSFNHSTLAAGLLVFAAACGGGEPPPASPSSKVAGQASPSSQEEAACEAAMDEIYASLRAPVRLTAYVSKGTPRLDALGRELRAELDSLAQRSRGKVEVTVIDVDTEAERERAKEDGLQEVVFGESEAGGDPDEARLVRGFLGVSLKYGAESESVSIQTSGIHRGLYPYWIRLRIRELRDREHSVAARFGVISGKSEIKLSEPNLVASAPGGSRPSMKDIFDQALPFYKFEDVDLRGGEAAIDPALKGLIITQPGEDFTERELRRVDQFLLLGDKSVVIFAGAVNLAAADASMTASLDTRGLEALLDGYGIEMRSEAVFDWGSAFAIPVPLQTGERALFRAPGVVLVKLGEAARAEDQPLDASFAGFFGLDEVVFPFPSTLVPRPSAQPGAVMKVVARSTPKSTVEAAGPISMKVSSELKPKGEYGERAIAIALTGKLTSAFAGRGGARGIDVPAAPRGESRLLVISASQFLTNPFARASNPPPASPQPATTASPSGDEMPQLLAQPYAQNFVTATILAFKNILDWMHDGDLLRGCSARKARGGE